MTKEEAKQLQVGDIVRIMNNKTTKHQFDGGDIVRVRSEYNGEDLTCELPTNSKEWWWVQPDEIENV